VAEVTTTATGINWGQIGANVVNNLVGAGLNISTSALNALVAQKLAPKVEEAKKQAAAPAQPQVIVQQAPAVNWQKYVPYALGGAAVLGVAYFALGKRARR